MMYEYETPQDELDRRDGIPDYYDTMYLDGYDVNQICRAFDKVQRRKFRKINTAGENGETRAAGT